MTWLNAGKLWQLLGDTTHEEQALVVRLPSGELYTISGIQVIDGPPGHETPRWVHLIAQPMGQRKTTPRQPSRLNPGSPPELDMTEWLVSPAGRYHWILRETPRGCRSFCSRTVWGKRQTEDVGYPFCKRCVAMYLRYLKRRARSRSLGSRPPA